MRKLSAAFILLGLALCVHGVSAQGTSISKNVPDRPVPQRLVNDFAGMLSPASRSSLEQRLVAFDRATSTQIAIVTVDSLYGMEINDYAVRLFEKWGIGQKGKDNGVLILAKPKTAWSYGEVFICTGYGVEGVVTDAVARRIVDNEMIPMFAKGDVDGGFNAAVDVLMSLLQGEFSADEYAKPKNEDGGLLRDIIVIALIVALVVWLSRRSDNDGSGKNDGKSGGRNSWPLIFFGGFGPRGGGGFGGGGFGGFGGGNTGGGGAGGRW